MFSQSAIGYVLVFRYVLPAIIILFLISRIAGVCAATTWWIQMAAAIAVVVAEVELCSIRFSFIREALPDVAFFAYRDYAHHTFSFSIKRSMKS